jgi:glutathione S-transferase
MKLYSKPDCLYCDKVKDFMQANNISGIELDESYNIAEVLELGGQQKFPFFVDAENRLYDSGVIIQYLTLKSLG